MPRSRAPSPSGTESSPKAGEGASSTEREKENEDKAQVCPSVQHHPGLTIPNPNSPMLASDGSGSTKKKVKYVKPRLGNNFQAKIGPFQPKRESEDLDSDDAMKNSNSNTNKNDGSKSSSIATGGKRKRAGRPPKGGRLKQQESTEQEVYNPTLKTKRGGLCIHRPSSTSVPSASSTSTSSSGNSAQQSIITQDQYLSFCRNITLQTPKDRNHNRSRADHIWKTALDQGRYEALEKVVVRQKKRGRKRKLETSKSDVSIASFVDGNNDNNSDSNNNSNVSVSVGGTNGNGGTASREPSPCPSSMDGNANATISDNANINNLNPGAADIALGMEGDYHMLEYLQLKGLGKGKRAQFLMLVELCRGTAVRTRRRIRKAQKNDEAPLSAVLSPMSDSWIRRYERVGSTIIGDHRRNPGQSKHYPYFGLGDASSSSVYPWSRDWGDQNYDGGNVKESKANKNAQSISASWDDYEKVNGDKDLMNAWACVLEKGQVILENYKNGNKPILADLLTLLNKAHSMPTPEDVYQKRDTMPKQLAQSLNSILDLVENGRMVMAHLVDAMYNDSSDGTELQALRKTLDAKASICTVGLEEMGIAREILNECLQWESRLTASNEGESSSSEDLHLPQQSLMAAERLANEGRMLALRPNSLVLLEGRIHRAYELRNRIRIWNENNANEKDSVKLIKSMIKEANKINLSFHELSLLSKVHRHAEEWMDRANVALRSKISLSELESLIETGENMPLGLTGSLEKLKARYQQVCDWINTLKVEVPCPLESVSDSGCNLDAGNRAEWLLKMMETLKSGADDSVTALIELSSKGSRLPVEVDFLHLLQTAIDARNWSQKAKRWVPSAGDQFKRGKIEDLQDHLDSAEDIVKKAKSLTEGKAELELDFAHEIEATVEKAEAWFEKYKPYLTGDNRRANNRNSISYSKLRRIVEEAEELPTNLGNPFIKINRIHNEAEDWMETNQILLQRCGVDFGEKADTSSMKPVSIDEVNNAIDTAAKELSVDLDEVKLLNKMAEQSQGWFDQALTFAPKRNKRIVGSNKDKVEKCALEKVVSLIESASSIPMDTTEDVERLRRLLSEVQSWRLDSQMKIKDIASTIKVLIHERYQFYGKPDKFLEVASPEPMDVESPSKDDSSVKNDQSWADPVEQPSLNANGMSNSSPDKRNGNDVYKMVETLSKSADSVYILTLEEQIAKQLESIMKWCKKIAPIIDSHQNVFVEKRWKKDLDVMIRDGSEMNLSSDKFTVPIPSDGTEENAILEMVTKSIVELVSGDMTRLTNLRHKRDEYYLWCKNATEAYIESDKRVPFETLVGLAAECSIYPPNAETVKRITKDSKIAVAWVADVKNFLDSGNKMSLVEVKNKLNKVSRVKITSPEYNSLRKAHQNAKNWTNKVKKSGLHDGSAQIHVLKELLREHDELIIAVPEELEELKQTLCGYCICRRPYEGFMIGCDECGEWYHGPCIGITQAQGNKLEKYVCARCCVKRVYGISTKKAAQVVRKWCDKKDLSKARSQDNQKHQRKIREKNREIEKRKLECQASLKELERVKTTQLDRANEKQMIAGQIHAAGEISNPSLLGNLEIDIKLREEVVVAKNAVTRATDALEQANQKMIEFLKATQQRKENQRREDQSSPSFKYWAAMIRSEVLAPDTDEFAVKSIPKPTTGAKASSDLLSEPMKEVLTVAKDLGIGDFPDIRLVREAFQCIGWCCLAFDILMKKPHVDDLRCLLKLGELIKLPEVKSIGMIRSMISRTSVWRAKVKKALTPIANETKPFNLEILKQLGMGMSTIPVITPEETTLCNAIADEGERHCVCGGPRDEILMQCCTSCKKWFHRKCLNAQDDSTENWKCSFCQSGANSTHKKTKKTTVFWPFLGSGEEDISTHAPIAKKLWPPFGLSNTPEAQNAFGLALTYKIENMERPKIKKFESIDDIVKKAASITNLGTQIHNPSKVVSVKIKVPIQKSIGPTPMEEPSTSMLTACFPSDRTIPISSDGKEHAPSSLSGSILVANTTLLPVSPSKQLPNACVANMRLNGKSTHIENQKLSSSSSFVDNSTSTINITEPISGGVNSLKTPVVEGLASGVVQDALLVAREVAEITPILQIATHFVEPSVSQDIPKPAVVQDQIQINSGEGVVVAKQSVNEHNVSSNSSPVDKAAIHNEKKADLSNSSTEILKTALPALVPKAVTNTDAGIETLPTASISLKSAVVHISADVGASSKKQPPIVGVPSSNKNPNHLPKTNYDYVEIPIASRNTTILIPTESVPRVSVAAGHSTALIASTYTRNTTLNSGQNSNAESSNNCNKILNGAATHSILKNSTLPKEDLSQLATGNIKLGTPRPL